MAPPFISLTVTKGIKHELGHNRTVLPGHTQPLPKQGVSESRTKLSRLTTRSGRKSMQMHSAQYRSSSGSSSGIIRAPGPRAARRCVTLPWARGAPARRRDAGKAGRIGGIQRVLRSAGGRLQQLPRAGNGRHHPRDFLSRLPAENSTSRHTPPS